MTTIPTVCQWCFHNLTYITFLYAVPLKQFLHIHVHVRTCTVLSCIKWPTFYFQGLECFSPSFTFIGNFYVPTAWYRQYIAVRCPVLSVFFVYFKYGDFFLYYEENDVFSAFQDKESWFLMLQCRYDKSSREKCKKLRFIPIG